MAVYKRNYRRFTGSLSPEWTRWWILPRFAFEDMRQRRFLTLFFLGSFILPLVFALLIYISHSLDAIKLLQLKDNNLLKPDAGFFMGFLGFQGFLAFFMAAFTGPPLISRDVFNNAMPLYLSRPFSRAEYVFGKASVLLILLSAMTWVPGLLLFALQGYLEGNGWAWNHGRIGWAIFLGSMLWVAILTLLALALSAWVKWKPVATGLMFAMFFISSGAGESINEALGTTAGNYINIAGLVGATWETLFDPVRRGRGPVFFGVREGEIAIWEAVGSLALLCLFCLWMLGKKVRAAEVVK